MRTEDMHQNPAAERESTSPRFLFFIAGCSTFVLQPLQVLLDDELSICEKYIIVITVALHQVTNHMSDQVGQACSGCVCQI